MARLRVFKKIVRWPAVNTMLLYATQHWCLALAMKLSFKKRNSLTAEISEKTFFFLLYLGWMNNERLIDQQAWHNFRIFFSYSCSLQKQRQMKIESPVRENSHGGVWPGRKLRVIELRESFRSQENTASRIRSYSKIVDKINVFFFYFSTMFFESVKWEFLVEKR